MKRLLYLLFIPFFGNAQEATGYDYFKYLYDHKEYKLASIELDSIEQLEGPSDTLIHYRLLTNYKSGNLPEVFRFMRKMEPSGVISGHTALSICYLQDSLELARQLAKRMQVNPEFKVIALLLAHDHAGALLALKADSLNISNAPLYAELISEHMAVPKKSKGLAMTMSAIVPYSGKYYLGQPMDATGGLFMTALHAALAGYAFADYGVKSVFAWVNAGAATVFYISGWVGTAQAYHRYKQKVQIHTKDAIQERLHYLLGM